ncbi:hypothetical protein [Nannocystis punicea]|uniref:Uncharacterized protein n=1 Tax=Nannocystis punicea TaxID=2995304 RepID=A0ABY7GYI7_9BACT|nr:hypothetical protein [Nannocystis poenicansa]WAS92048.1 hypothetical protein O0S08_38185 [Nannocystis poenicansa]
MNEQEQAAAADAARTETRGHVRVVLSVAVLSLVPLALAGAPVLHVLLAWLAVLVVYGGLLWLFGLRSAIEVGVGAFLLAVNAAVGLWGYQLEASAAERAKNRPEAAPSGDAAVPDTAEDRRAPSGAKSRWWRVTED